MLKFRIDVRVRETLKAKCPRHPKYDPSADEKLHTESGCSACSDIRALQTSRVALEDAVRAFERRSYQWRVASLNRKAMN
jgi:hypothetical protein